MDSNSKSHKPIGFLMVACDSRTVQNIAVTCKCGTRWTERVPEEVHNSRLICIFNCPKCGTEYGLRNHELRRMDDVINKENSDARRQTFSVATSNKREFDA